MVTFNHLEHVFGRFSLWEWPSFESDIQCQTVTCLRQITERVGYRFR